MRTSKSDLALIDNALATIPKALRTRLVKHYLELKQAFLRGSLDACGARAGKFSETLIRIIQQILEGTHAKFGEQINLYVEARRLEALPKTSGPEPIRVFIPRALCFLYTLRNKRGFAHVGADLDSEPIDAITCARVADWCLCEVIRVVHNLPIEEAQALVNSIAVKEMPEVWSVAGKRRVLNPGLGYKDQVLLMLYGDPHEAVLIEDLFAWTEYSRFDRFKACVLRPLHEARRIEWDRDTDTAIISPTGIHHVETELLKPEELTHQVR